jgi:hypothetical protein
MSKKITIKTVDAWAKENRPDCKLKSTIYVKCKGKLDFECSNNHIFSMSFDNFKRGKICCHCDNILRSVNQRTPIDDIYSLVIKKNFEFIEWVKEYQNNTSKMRLKCQSNHIFITTPIDLKNNKYVCSECAGNNKKDGNIVYQAFINKDLTPLFTPDEYINQKQKLPFTCKIHPFEVQTVTWTCVKKNDVTNCKYCAIDKKTRENSCKWRGGITSLTIYLRGLLNDWKIDSFKHNNYRCVLTNINSNKLAVHHLYGFKQILVDTLKRLSLPIKDNIGKYTELELKNIVEEFLNFHNENIGIVVIKPLHTLFHKLYSYGDNTPEQFKEFKIRLKLGEFDDFLKENNLKLII